MRTGARLQHDDGLCPLCGSPRKHDTSIVIGDLRLEDGTVTKGHLSVTLSPVPFRILAAYAKRAGRGVSRDSIMAIVYGDHDNPPDEKIIDQHVHNLRAIVGRDAIESRFGGIKVFHADRVRLNPDQAQYAADAEADKVIRKWSAAENAQLAAMVAEGLRDPEIARRLGRTVQAVRDRRRRTLRKGYPRGYNGGEHPRWSAEEDATLRAMFAEGKGDRDIALVLQRRWPSIRERRRRLDLIRAPGWHWRHRRPGA